MNSSITWSSPGLPAVRFVVRLFLLGVLLIVALPLSVIATTVVAPQFEQLVNGSDYVVRAVVKSVTAEYRTKNGRRKIYTRIEVEVREVIAGQPPTPLVLEMLGGRIGEEELRVEGAPQFQVGQEDILFVRNNGKAFHPLTAVMYGRYPVMKEKSSGREYVARANHVPLSSTDEVALPLTEGSVAQLQQQAKAPATALTPAQFAQLVRSAVKSAATPARLH